MNAEKLITNKRQVISEYIQTRMTALYNATKLRNVGPVRCTYKLAILNNILNVSFVTAWALYLIPRTIILYVDVYEKLGKFYVEFVQFTVTFDQ